MPEGYSTVRELMSEDVVSVTPDSTVSKALAAMRKHGIHELPVMENTTLKGWVTYETIFRRGRLPPEAKVDNVMDMPARLEPETSPVDAADSMIKLQARALPVVDAKGHVIGILSRTDLLKAAAADQEVASQAVEKAMTRELEVVGEDAELDQVEHRLRSLAINQLLVVDENGRLVGSIGMEEITEATQREDTKQRRTSRDGAPAGGPGRRKDRHVQVGSMTRTAPTVEPDATLADAIERMQEHNTWFVVAVEDGRPVGVLSRADILARMAATRAEEGVVVQISGLQDKVDQSVYDQIYSKAQTTLTKAAQEETLEFLGLHYKAYKGKGEASKWSLTAHLSTQKQFYVAKADAWDILQATDEAFDILEDRVRHRKEMRLENRKGGAPRRAVFYRSS